MGQKRDIKTQLTTVVIYFIASFIFLAYDRVVVEFYRNLPLLFLPPVICVLAVFWLKRTNKISFKATAELDSFQHRLFVVTGFAIGYSLVFCAMYFFLA